eukprot:1331156-Prorocentrum_lima.AAC.1
MIDATISEHPLVQVDDFIVTIHLPELVDDVSKAELMLKFTELLGQKGDVAVTYGDWIWESG